jgi:hypothetical protein
MEDKLPDSAQTAQMNPLADKAEIPLVSLSPIGVNWAILSEVSVELQRAKCDKCTDSRSDSCMM